MQLSCCSSNASSQARRRLAAALVHDADNATYHHLMAVALEEDPKGNRDQALEHYRHCVRLEPIEPVYLCDAGLFALKHGAVDEGISYLRRAVELAPDDVDVVGTVVRGLQERGCHDEARARSPKQHYSAIAGIQDFQMLWNDCRFQELHNRQERVNKRKRLRNAAAQGPICLPFLQLTVETPRGRKLVRTDRPSRTPAPHILRMARLSGRKHA